MASRRRAVFTVTDAPKPLSEDIRRRQTRYLVHSGIRAGCLVLVVVVPMPLPLLVLLVVAAIALPYVAVVVANGRPGPEPAPRLDKMGKRGDVPTRYRPGCR